MIGEERASEGKTEKEHEATDTKNQKFAPKITKLMHSVQFKIKLLEMNK